MVMKLQRSNFWFVTLTLLILVTDITITCTVSFEGEDRLLAYAVLLDFMIVIPFLYWLCILRKKGKSFTKALPLPILGAIAAWLVLPLSVRNTLWHVIWPIELLIIVVEVIFIGYEIRILYRLFQRYRSVSGVEFSKTEALRISVHDVIGNGKLASVLLHDISMIYYLLYSWGKTREITLKDTSSDFTYHRKTSQMLNALILTKILVLEGVVVHLLVQQWSSIAAWILTAADIWFLALIWADYRASVLNPVHLKDGILRLRYGLRIQGDVCLDQIDEVTSSLKYHPDQKEQNDSVLPLLATPNVRIQLKRPIRVEGILFLPRMVSNIYLSMDEPEKFVQVFKQLKDRDMHEKVEK